MAHPISFRALGFHFPHFKRRSTSVVQSIPFSVVVERTALRQAVRVNLERGLMISAVFHFALVGTYYGIEYLNNEDDVPVVRLRIMKYSDLGPPPSITNSMAAPVVGVANAAKPSIGVPVPVPDAEINPDQTIATQTELGAVPGPAIDGTTGGTGDNVQITDDATISDDPGINDFIPVEKAPQVVRSVQPEYPDIAQRAGVEGAVWLRILVDKTGKPQKTVVIKEDGSGLFKDAAVEAAMKYEFTPAYMNSGPVKVWVSIKFTFTLTK